MYEKAHKNIVVVGEIASNQHLLYFPHNISLLNEREIPVLPFKPP